uniref:uncharacterized protein n=1 Tax=Myxine glutinosa TaxID=7769 RepID=UPI00358E87F2
MHVQTYMCLLIMENYNVWYFQGLLQSGEFLNHEVLMGITTSEAARLAPPSDLSRPRLRRQLTRNSEEEPDHEIPQGFNIPQGLEPDFEENNILQDAALSTLPGIGLKNIPPSPRPDAGSSQLFASTENSLVLPNSLTSNFVTNPQAPLTASSTTTISVRQQQPTALSVAYSAPLSPLIPAPLSAPLTAPLPPSLHCRFVSRPPSPPIPDPLDPWGVQFEAAVQWVTRRHSGSGQSAAGTALGAAVRFMYTDWSVAGEGGTWSGEMNSQEEKIGQTNMEQENYGEGDPLKERSSKIVEEGTEGEKERKKIPQWDKKKADKEHSKTTKDKEKSRVRMSRWREQTIALLSDALFLSPAMAEAELRARFGSVIYLYALTGSCGGGRHGEKPNKRKKRGIEVKKVNKTMANMKLSLKERDGQQRKMKQWSKKGEMGNLGKIITAMNERWRERIEKKKGLRRINVRSKGRFRRDDSESGKQNEEIDGGGRAQINEDKNHERERNKHIALKVRARKRCKDRRERRMQQGKLIITANRCDQRKTGRVKSGRLRREVSERERRDVERDNDIRWERDRKSWREAGHGDELAYMFGLPWLAWKRGKMREAGGGSSKEFGQPSGISGKCSYGERDAELSFLIMMYWANFVKTGNPNLRVPLTDSPGEAFTEQKVDIGLQMENSKVGIDLQLENSKIGPIEKGTNFQPAILGQTSAALYPNVPLVTQRLKPSWLDDGNWAKKSDLPGHFEPLWPRFSTSRRRYLTLGSRIRVRFNLRATRLAFWSQLVPVLMATGNTRFSPRRYYPRPCFRGPHAPASRENWGERAAGRELEAEHESGESWGLSYTLACGSAFLFLNLVAVAALNYVRDRGASHGDIGIRGHRGHHRRGWGIGSGSWGLIENRGLGPGDWGLASDNQGLGVGDWGLGSESRRLATGSWGASEPDLFPTVDYVFTLRRSPHDLLPWQEGSGRTGGENRHEEEHDGETELRRC